VNDISSLVICCDAFCTLETTVGSESDMQVAVDYANQAQDPIRYPDHNGRPEIEPVFMIFKYDDMTTRSLLDTTSSRKTHLLETTDKSDNREENMKDEESLICSASQPVHRKWEDQYHGEHCL
jgi:hypothetical protein